MKAGHHYSGHASETTEMCHSWWLFSSLLCLKFRWGELLFAKQLIEKYNIDPNCSDDSGVSPLHWACMHDM